MIGWQQVLRHCAFTLILHRPVSPSARHQPSWQQPWWSGMHCTPSWLWGHGRHCVSHNAITEYKRPCTCYLPLREACWRWPTAILKGSQLVQALWRERGELLIEFLGKWFWETIQACTYLVSWKAFMCQSEECLHRSLRPSSFKSYWYCSVYQSVCKTVYYCCCNYILYTKYIPYTIPAGFYNDLLLIQFLSSPSSLLTPGLHHTRSKPNSWPVLHLHLHCYSPGRTHWDTHCRVEVAW